MQDEPSRDQTPPPDPIGEDALDPDQNSRGSDAEVIGVSNAGGRGSDAEVIGVSNALDLVDEALEALDQDDLELAEEIADQLQDRPFDEG